MILDLRGNDWPVVELGADAIENISYQVRSEYVDLMTRLGLSRRGDVDWWVTSLASRNTYACPLYQRLCQLVLVKKLYEKGEAPDEIVTDSPALAAVFRQFLGASIKVSVFGGSNKFSRLLGFCRRYAAALYHAACQYLCSALWLEKSKLPDNGTVLVDIFTSASSFTNNNIVDRYYPGMMEALDETERKKFFYTPIHYKVRDYRVYFKKLNQCHNQILLKEDVLTLTDYVYALMHPLRLRWPGKNIYFMGLDVGGLVREALSQTFSNSSSIEGLLRYRFSRRLNKMGFKPGKIIEWFENQEVDHGAIAGWREFFPEVEVIGYQGYLASRHYLCSFPIKQEQEYLLLPTKVVVIGENMIDSAREFIADLNVVTGPAFRFSSVWDELKNCRDKAGFSILVALPIHNQESTKIIDVLVGAVEKYRQSSPVNVFIKPHPTWKAAEISQLFSGREFDFELLDSSFDDALAASDLVVSSASSVCVYAIARGVPCVIVGFPGMLLQNPIHPDTDSRLWRTCYSSAELSNEFEYFSSLRANEKDDLRNLAAAYRAVQFVPVTRESVFDFVELAD